MAKIKSTSKSPRYDALRADSTRLGERNDCTVVSVAATTGVAYGVAHAQLAHYGRKPGRGAPLYVIANALKALGFKIENVPAEYFIRRYPKGKQDKSQVTTHQPERFPGAWEDGHNYILLTSGYRHAVGIVNGENVDWTRGRAMRVAEIWRIVRA